MILTDYPKKKLWSGDFSLHCCVLNFKMWQLNSEIKADECKFAGVGFNCTEWLANIIREKSFS